MTHSERFTPHATAYVQGRPTYPAALGDALRGRGLLERPVADVGAGTGLFTRLLLESGARVSAIEPNAAMRAELERELAPAVQTGALRVLPGTAEASGLEAGSVGLVSVAQAVHWFDPVPTVAEFRRVLAPGGTLLLVRNELDRQANPLAKALYSRGDRALGVPGGHRLTPEVLRAYFGDRPVEALRVPNPLPFSRERLHALLGSLSGLPAAGTAEHAGLLRRVDAAFDEHQRGGVVTLDYVTEAYLGAL